MPESESIQVMVNGKALRFTPGTRLPEVVTSLHLDPANVVTERNEQALTQSEAATVTVENGDRIEIVQIVAGG